MAAGNKTPNGFVVLKNCFYKCFMLKLAFDCHLFIDFCTKAWNEGLQNNAEEHKCVQSCVQDLGTASGVLFCELPRLVLLHVQVAFTAVLHRCAKTILKLYLLHQVNVLGKVLEQVRNEKFVN